jgi:hypothetical protein
VTVVKIVVVFYVSGLVVALSSNLVRTSSNKGLALGSKKRSKFEKQDSFRDGHNSEDVPIVRYKTAYCSRAVLGAEVRQ